MKKSNDRMIHNRILKMVILSFAMFGFLVFRLYWIQIVNHESLKVQALKQRGEEIKLTPDRGVIYDRNLLPITNRKKVIMGFFFKEDIESDSLLRQDIIRNSYMDEIQLTEYIKKKKTIVDIPLTTDSLLIYDKEFFIANKIERYDDINLLAHVIGHINRSENKGEAGIEKVYDDILRNEIDKSVYVELDSKRRKFTNREYLANRDADSKEPSGVKLTIDYNIQQVLEKVLDKEQKKGAIIIADVESGDILAMASRPNYDQDNIGKHLDKEDMALYNKAVQVGYPPGSLFKSVVLLTALEEGYNSYNQFYCKGYEKVGNTVISCNNKMGHGYINLKEAFSKSCNSAFIQLGQELGSDKIIDMANRLGYGSKINIGLPEEIKGNLPSGTELLGPAIGNISIGQGSIEVTPLQITNMMLTIINDGFRKDMAIVDGIVSREGDMVKKFARSEDIRIISEKNSRITKEYLGSVVKEGTAKNLKLDNIGGAGGKTGSAEAILNGYKTVHGWFSGFYPLNNPKYVITILIEDGESGSQIAVPIFEEIIRSIANINS